MTRNRMTAVLAGFLLLAVTGLSACSNSPEDKKLGFTDTEGTTKYDHGLSDRRAEARAR